MEFILSNKPVLVGLHLGFAILGIDFLLWLLGELIAKSVSFSRMRLVAWGAFLGFFLSWLIGGYYYVKYYGPLVKPAIKASSTPWAHTVIMEAKEHIFLFLIPMALTILLGAYFNSKENNLNSQFKMLVGLTAAFGLLIGLMGFIISAAARWA